MTKENELQHIAIIMDGNGRWATQRGLPRSVGHKKGAEVVKTIAKAAADAGVRYLTLYAFSTENWQRSQEEVNALMTLLRQYLKSDLKELKEHQVRMMFIGERYMLDADIQKMMSDLENETAQYQKMTLCIALSYGSRQEILSAVKQVAMLVRDGKMTPDDITIQSFSDMLYTKGIPDPDLLIRTSGEQRISNYLLWQLAYSEFIFTDVLWPDFTAEHLQNLIKTYQTRERRYGKV